MCKQRAGPRADSAGWSRSVWPTGQETEPVPPLPVFPELTGLFCSVHRYMLLLMVAMKGKPFLLRTVKQARKQQFYSAHFHVIIPEIQIRKPPSILLASFNIVGIPFTPNVINGLKTVKVMSIQVVFWDCIRR